MCRESGDMKHGCDPVDTGRKRMCSNIQAFSRYLTEGKLKDLFPEAIVVCF